MNIGELNRRVEILRFVEEHDSYGGVNGDWQVLCKKWAKVEENAGNEAFENDQIQANRSTRITLRYYPELQEVDRIKYKNKVYEILSILDKDSGHYKTIVDCKELVKNGL